MIDTREMQRYEREIAAMLRRAGSDDAEAFAQVVGLLDKAVKFGTREAAARLRAPADNGQAPPIPWHDLARALGVTKSAAFQRFGKRPDARPAAAVDDLVPLPGMTA